MSAGDSTSSTPIPPPARRSPAPLHDLLLEYEREGVVIPLELRQILDAIRLLKTESGWGRIEMVFKNSDMTDVNTTIWQKSRAE